MQSRLQQVGTASRQTQIVASPCRLDGPSVDAGSRLRRRQRCDRLVQNGPPDTAVLHAELLPR